MDEHFEAPALDPSLVNHAMPFFIAVGMERGSEQYIRLAADPTLQKRMCPACTSCRAKKNKNAAPRSRSTL